LPDGWEAPDVIDIPAAGRARQQFQLKPVSDPTYRRGNDIQYSDDEDVDDVDDVESDKDTKGKRKRKVKATTPKKAQKTTSIVEAAVAPRPVKKRASDPTYRQDNDVQYSDDDDENDIESDKDTNGKRKRKGKATTAKKSQKATVDVETAVAPRPVKKRTTKAAKSQAVLLQKEARPIQEEEVITRRSTRKRQKTVKE
jgi:hypothetical protein